MIINVVVVTYNRKQLLLRCLGFLFSQTVPLDRIYIIDNASTDGTYSYLLQHDIPTKDIVRYCRLPENSGGSGGFHFGLKEAMKDDPDFVWIMDDDGYPSVNCLEKQLELAGKFDYVMPVSLDVDCPEKLSWFIRKADNKWTRSYIDLRDSFPDGIMYSATPFNGLLMSRNLLNQVGLPKKEMFIWGDEYEHQYRCHKKGFATVTKLDALFFHPRDIGERHYIFFGMIPLKYTKSKLRFTCLIRNSTYNYWNYKGKYLILCKFFIYTWFFLVTKKISLKEYVHYLRCVQDGVLGRFDRHKQFL